MEVTVVSHAGIANRIKNILSALSQYDVSTQHETINYLFPSIPLVEEPSRTFPEDWRLVVTPEEEKYCDEYKTIDLLFEKTPEYFIEKYLKF